MVGEGEEGGEEGMVAGWLAVGLLVVSVQGHTSVECCFGAHHEA